MKKIILTVSVLSVLVGAAAAQGAKPAPKATPCPVCKMPLATKMSKENPTAVRLKKGGPVLYCCAHCKMPASVLVKPKK